MRRGSLRAGAGEPLIVVEESACGEEAADGAESPPDPYLLSPWRDARKHSLPTPACTSGPTASQVRRLSERGEGSARAAREAAFLATLSQAPPQPGARRHSVVTISRVPQSLFGRGRRESVAALPVRARRDSNASTPCPPATESMGSTHNLQLDIMDDIVAARRVRMRVWSAAGERLCEVQPLGGAAGAAGTRYARRRHSAQPQGVVCSDADLAALTSSAADLAACPPAAPRPRLADTRSRSFDAGALRGADPPGAWLARRHQTLAAKRENMARPPPDKAKVVWDKPSGSVVDAQALGSAIEVFLRGGASEPPARPPAPPPRPTPPARPAPPWPEADAPDACDSALCSSIKDLFVK